MNKKISILLLSIFACFVFAGSLFADNRSRQVYGLYSQIYPGGIYDQNSSASNDYMSMATYSGGTIIVDNNNGPNLGQWYTAMTPQEAATSPDGNQYHHYQLPNTWNTVVIFFPGPTGAWQREDMSMFYGGEIECWIRSTDTNIIASQLRFGFQPNTAGNGVGDMVWTIQQLMGATPAEGGAWNDGNWHRITIPLSNTVLSPGGTNTGITSTMLGDNSGGIFPMVTPGTGVAVPFEFMSSANVTFDICRILYKKQNQVINTASDVGFSIQLKNRADQTAASSITWNTASLKSSPSYPYVPADQYFEMKIDYLQLQASSTPWKLMIYTDSKNPGVSSPTYTGAMDTTTVSGMIDINHPGNPMIPMMWRATLNYYDESVDGSTTGVHGLFPFTESSGDYSAFQYWGNLRDKSTFTTANNSTVYYGSDDVTIADMRGIHSVIGTGGDAGNYYFNPITLNSDNSLSDATIRLYILANCTGAAGANGTYRNGNIVIDFMTE